MQYDVARFACGEFAHERSIAPPFPPSVWSRSPRLKPLTMGRANSRAPRTQFLPKPHGVRMALFPPCPPADPDGRGQAVETIFSVRLADRIGSVVIPLTKAIYKVLQ
jgi:hypothetical protein